MIWIKCLSFNKALISHDSFHPGEIHPGQLTLSFYLHLCNSPHNYVMLTATHFTTQPTSTGFVVSGVTAPQDCARSYSVAGKPWELSSLSPWVVHHVTISLLTEVMTFQPPSSTAQQACGLDLSCNNRATQVPLALLVLAKDQIPRWPNVRAAGIHFVDSSTAAQSIYRTRGGCQSKSFCCH